MADEINVLVIDDEQNIRDILEYNLIMDGFIVHTAADGEQGLTIARQNKLDLILLDWMMPDLSGLEVLEIIKNTRKLQKIPVFMLTAKGMVGEVEKAFEVGADDYLTKPFDPIWLSINIREKLKQIRQGKKPISTAKS